jgi:adenine-specific DNA-methyltransferase
LHHPLDALIAQGKGWSLPDAEIRFDMGQHDGKISILEPYLVQSGSLKASVFTVESFDQAYEYLILADGCYG